MVSLIDCNLELTVLKTQKFGRIILIAWKLVGHSRINSLGIFSLLWLWARLLEYGYLFPFRLLNFGPSYSLIVSMVASHNIVGFYLTLVDL